MFGLGGVVGGELGTSVPLALVAAFAGGLAASLTPCVYPLIPIVAGYIGSKGLGETSRSRCLVLSTAYVLGMATVYAGLGVVAALTGSLFGTISTSPVVFLVVANVMILLGLTMLDAIPLPRLPVLDLPGTGRRGLLGALAVGAASGLVASPCTSPVLGTLLAYVGARHNVVLGATLLFVFSLGLGLPVVVVGTFSGLVASLPKPGRWMVWMKKILGLAMIALGEYYLVRAGQAWL